MLHKMGKEGFSLIEVIVSMVLLSIIFIPITSGFIQSMKASEEAKIMQQANVTAQSIMEDFKNKPIDELYTHYPDHTPTMFSSTDNTLTFKQNYKDDATGAKLVATITLSKDATSEIQDINNVEVPQIYDMSSPKNVVGVAATLPDWIVYDIMGKNPGKTETQVRNSFSTEYIIHIEDHSPYPTVTIKAKYTSSLNPAYVIPQEDIAAKTMATDLENIYFYYEATNNEKLTVINDCPSAKDVNFFISATMTSPDPSYELHCTTDELNDPSRNYRVISNVKIKAISKVFGIATADQYVVKKMKKTRRYQINVSVGREQRDGSVSHPYCVLESTRGE